MNKASKIALNLVIFLVVIGFAWYMAASINKGDSPVFGTTGDLDAQFVSPYKQLSSFKLPDDINRFELWNNRLYISAGQQVYIFDTEGKQLGNFQTDPNVRDITVSNDEIYLLYPTRIVVHSISGEPIRRWEACSNLSDYCSFTIAGDAVFVTDAENKDICKYTTEGNFVKFIKSPAGFIIPSYSFDIDSWNDTIYCVNSGRHIVETYTLDGNFISYFGNAGSDAGSFAGCCNPAYISFTSDGALVTSEKGNPRISYFGRNGKFKGLALNSKMLGGGNTAYELRALDDKLFVTTKNKVSVFQCDQSSILAASCPRSCAGCPFQK